MDVAGSPIRAGNGSADGAGCAADAPGYDSTPTRGPRRLTANFLRLMESQAADHVALALPDGSVAWADHERGEPCKAYSVQLDCFCRLDSDGPGKHCHQHQAADWPRELYA